MYQKVFRRDEKKYLLTVAQKQALLSSIQTQIQPDQYFATTICSLYFDTPNNELIIRSIEKPVFKQKVRLRSYGVPKLNDKVFFEIKYKFRGIVSKRRFKLELSEFENFIHQAKDNKPSTQNSQIMRELKYLFRLYDLRPACVICYDRESYCGVEHPELRITFDNSLRSRHQDLDLSQGDYGVHYFADDKCIMEIKALNAMPLWLTHTLSRLRIYPASFTKYGKVYQQSKERIIC